MGDRVNLINLKCEVLLTDRSVDFMNLKCDALLLKEFGLLYTWLVDVLVDSNEEALYDFENLMSLKGEAVLIW